MIQARDLALCGACALMMPIGQVMFKMAANRHNDLSGYFINRISQNPFLFAALILYAATAMLWFYVLTRLPLSQAYPIVILGAGLVPVFAWIFFREPLSWSLAAGYVLILSGLAVVQRTMA